MGPEIQRTTAFHGLQVVGRVVLNQDAEPPGGPTAAESGNQLVIETMEGEGAGIADQSFFNQSLDTAALDFHEKLGSPGHELANGIKRRKVGCQSSELAHGGPAYRRAVRERGVMVHDDDTIRGGVHVQLNALSAALEGQLEAAKGILLGRAGHAAVCDP